jgi:hypothetical protein
MRTHIFSTVARIYLVQLQHVSIAARTYSQSVLVRTVSRHMLDYSISTPSTGMYSFNLFSTTH